MKQIIVLILHFLLMETSFDSWRISKPFEWLYDRWRSGYELRLISRLLRQLAKDESQSVDERQGGLTAIRRVINELIKDFEESENE